MSLNRKVETTIPMDQKQPFNASAIDRFNSWVKRLPVSAWLFYMAIGISLIVIQIAFLWREAGSRELELLPVIIFNGLFIPYLLGLIYILDNQSVDALNMMRPVLDKSESEFEQYQYIISNMPSRASLTVGLVTVVFVILMERLSGAPATYDALEELPLFAIVFQLIDKSSAFLFGAFIYHTIRQLRFVNSILDDARINLFNLAPLQAFSRLTASTAVGLMVGVYGWILINPELLSDPIVLAFVGFITLLAVAVFVWPLLGVHSRMEREKEKKLHALDVTLEAAFTQFNQAFRDEDHAAVERLNGTIGSLDIQRNRIAAIPTWPWKSETAQFVFAAIALPLVLAILQFLVEQALD